MWVGQKVEEVNISTFKETGLSLFVKIFMTVNAYLINSLEGIFLIVHCKHLISDLFYLSPINK